MAECGGKSLYHRRRLLITLSPLSTPSLSPSPFPSLSPTPPLSPHSSPPNPTPTNPPRYFTYNIVTSALGILFLLTTISLIHQRSLLPGIMLLGSLILLILWLVGLIVVSIELWGPQGNVAGNCQLYVQNRVSVGQSLDTLAWLEQNTICEFLPRFGGEEGRWRECAKKCRSELEGGVGVSACGGGVLLLDDDYELSGL